MTRRKSIQSLPLAAASPLAADQTPVWFELCRFELRNSRDLQMQRMSEFLRQAHLPAVERAGARVAGVFSNLIAPDGPFLLALTRFADFSAYESVRQRLEADRAYQKQLEALEQKGGLSYMRMERSLLRAFRTMPDIEIPQPKPTPRVFELRVYESNSPITLRRKIGMFEEGGEIAIFRRVGLAPVFFAETVIGPRLPNLTYLLAFDSMAAREKNWAAFLADPEWQKLRAKPGLSDAEIVSNISNTLLRPLPFSELR